MRKIVHCVTVEDSYFIIKETFADLDMSAKGFGNIVIQKQ